jgi:hypothetical protein
MDYREIGISPLTKTQINNYEKGKGVRVRAGNYIIRVSKPVFTKFHQNIRNGKSFTLYKKHIGSGIFRDAYNFVKRTPALKHAANYAIRTGKRYAHKGIDYLAGRAHQGIEHLPMIGDGLHHHHHRRLHHGHGVGGLVLNGAAGLSNLIGGHGSSEAADVLRGVGGVANFLGLGLNRDASPALRKHLEKLHKKNRKATPQQLQNLEKARKARAIKNGYHMGRALMPAGY